MKALKLLVLVLALFASPAVFAAEAPKAEPVSSATKEEKDSKTLFSRVNETYKKSEKQLRPQG